ncbi:MAG: ATP-binding protein [Coprobacillus sp.]|nr:ATP-binding protein [Coprobacillus sp.]
MSKLVVLTGVPGSGKSYFSALVRKANSGHVYIVSSDGIRELLGGSPQYFDEESLVWEMFYELPKVYALDKKAIVIMDATQTIKKYRTDAIQPLKPLFDETDMVYFDIDTEVVKEQNINRTWVVPEKPLNKFIKEFVPPSEEELASFDHVYFIKEPEDFQKIVNLL